MVNLLRVRSCCLHTIPKQASHPVKPQRYGFRKIGESQCVQEQSFRKILSVRVVGKVFIFYRSNLIADSPPLSHFASCRAKTSVLFIFVPVYVVSEEHVDLFCLLCLFLGLCSKIKKRSICSVFCVYICVFVRYNTFHHISYYVLVFVNGPVQ